MKIMLDNAKRDHDNLWVNHPIRMTKEKNSEESVPIYLNDLAFDESMNQKFAERTVKSLNFTRSLMDNFEENLLPWDDGLHRWGNGITAYYLDLMMRPRVQDLCRGRQVRPAKLDVSLKCRMVHHDRPYLRLGPFKYELKNSVPQLILIHEFATERECATIKDMSRGNMASTPYTTRGKTNAYSSARTSKILYLSEVKDPWKPKNLLSKWSDRVGAATKMTLYSERFASENYQIMNYGIGGAISGHLDATSKASGFIFGVHALSDRDQNYTSLSRSAAVLL